MAFSCRLLEEENVQGRDSPEFIIRSIYSFIHYHAMLGLRKLASANYTTSTKPLLFFLYYKHGELYLILGAIKFTS
jgi:hypothetical protein